MTAPQLTIPPPLDDDHEDVAWALRAASAQWRRSARADAVSWVRRAAETAHEVGHMHRGVELSALADDLLNAPEPSRPPSQTVSPPRPVPGGVGAPRPGSARPPGVAPPPPAGPPSSIAPSRAVPPPPPVSVRPPAPPAPRPPTVPPTSGLPLGARPMLPSLEIQFEEEEATELSTDDLDEIAEDDLIFEDDLEEEPPPGTISAAVAVDDDPTDRVVMGPSAVAMARASAPELAVDEVSLDDLGLDGLADLPDERTEVSGFDESEAPTSVTSVTHTVQPHLEDADSDYPTDPENQALSEVGPSESSRKPQLPERASVSPHESPASSRRASERPSAPEGSSASGRGALSERPPASSRRASSERPPASSRRAASERPPASSRKAASERSPVSSRRRGAMRRSSSAPAAGSELPEAPWNDSPVAAPEEPFPLAPSAQLPAVRTSRPPQVQVRSEVPGPPAEPIVDGVSLFDVSGLQDLPEEAQRELMHVAELRALEAGEEVSSFGVALVTRGSVEIMPAVADASCALAQRGKVVFTRGSLRDGVALRVVGAAPGTRVAVWSDEQLSRATASCPWVADELALVADRYQAFAGAAMGPLGDSLDAMFRGMVLDKCNVRRFGGAEILLEQGKPVDGMYIVGAGWVELLDGEGHILEVLRPGDFVFPQTILAAGAATASARAGRGGALMLYASRMDAHELLATCPPFIELLAG